MHAMSRSQPTSGHSTTVAAPDTLETAPHHSMGRTIFATRVSSLAHFDRAYSDIAEHNAHTPTECGDGMWTRGEVIESCGCLVWFAGEMWLEAKSASGGVAIRYYQSGRYIARINTHHR